MSDTLDETGLSIKTLATLVSELTASLQTIYGDDINIDSDSPDGQAINIFAQAAIDLREVLEDIYTSFDPDQAAGTVLDQRVAINGIKRKGATFTTLPIDITNDRAVTLTGMDDESESTDIPSGVYTVKDDAGNEFVLLDTVTLSTTGLHALDFRAAKIGAVEVTLNTITTPVTVVAGIITINNSASVTNQGVDEESDASLKIRRNKSLSNSATGYLDSIEGSLLEVSGVSEVAVNENTTDTTDADGIPAHSIWAIVEGGADADIGAVLYAKKSAGAGFYGAVSVDVPRTGGRTYEVLFDRPVDANLWIKFNMTLPGGVIDTDYIKTAIVENIEWGLGEDAVGDVITTYLKSINSSYRITAMLLSSDNTNWYEIVTAPTKKSRFVNAIARITIS